MFRCQNCIKCVKISNTTRHSGKPNELTLDPIRNISNPQKKDTKKNVKDYHIKFEHLA